MNQAEQRERGAGQLDPRIPTGQQHGLTVATRNCLPTLRNMDECDDQQQAGAPEELRAQDHAQRVQIAKDISDDKQPRDRPRHQQALALLARCGGKT